MKSVYTLLCALLVGCATPQQPKPTPAPEMVTNIIQMPPMPGATSSPPPVIIVRPKQMRAAADAAAPQPPILRAVIPPATVTNVPVKLRWDASPSVVVGYNLYARQVDYSENGLVYDLNAMKVGYSTTTNFTVVTNIPARRYSYFATAVDANGLESVPSNEVDTLASDGSRLKLVFSYEQALDTVAFTGLPGYKYTLQGRKLSTAWVSMTSIIVSTAAPKEISVPRGTNNVFRVKME